jgi:HSP20 family protein
MVRWYHRSIYDELDELKASMDYLFQLALEPTEDSQFLNGETDEIVCRYPHNINAEVTEYDDEVMVTVDMIPSMNTTGITVDLVDPDTLQISCDRNEEESTGNDRLYPREQRSFSLRHLVPLPVPVTRRGARSTLKHGVLDLHLKKVTRC